jgi:hypothetical protein
MTAFSHFSIRLVMCLPYAMLSTCWGRLANPLSYKTKKELREKKDIFLGGVGMGPDEIGSTP